MAALPSLVVNVALDTATFVSGLTRMEFQAQQSTKAIKQSIEGISSSVEKVAALIGVGLGVDAFKELVQGAIEAEAQLQLLGDRAGITGAQLSAFIGVAARSRTDLETVVQASTKLSKALLDFGNDTAKSTEVLKALGVTVKDIPGLLAAPNQALITIAKTLDQLPAGGTKAAANLLILGRGGAQAAAFLKELATQTELVNTRTQDEIDTAKQFADRIIDIGVATDTLKTKFANALIPTLDATVTAFLNATTGSGGLKEALAKLIAEGSIQEWARGAVLVLATVAESLAFVARVALAVAGSFRVIAADIDVLLAKSNAPSQKITGALGFSPEEAAAAEASYQKAIKHRDEVVTGANQSYIDLIRKNAAAGTEAINKAFADQDAALAAARSPKNITFADIQQGSADVAAKAKAAADADKRVQDAITAGHKSGKQDDPARAILEGQIKALEESISEEKSVLTTRQEFLTAYYQQGLLSVDQYYEAGQAARDEALKNIIQGYEKEIAAQQAYVASIKANDPQKDTKYQKALNAIEEVRAKEQKATTESINQSNLASVKHTQDNLKYADELDELNAKMYELAGNTAAAASIRFDKQTRDLQNILRASGNTQGLDQVAAIKATEQNQSKLNDVSKQYGFIVSDIAIQQGYLNLAQQSGAISEIDYLVKTSALNKSRLADMQNLVAQARFLASQPFATADQIQQAKQLELQLAQLAAQTDLLADKFNKTFGDAFSSAFSDFITGTKTAKEAFNDFVKQVTKQISDLASQNIASALFGKGGALSGAGDFFSKIFGGGLGDVAKDTGAVALTSAATLQTTAATSLLAAGAALDAAAAALSASAASSAIGSGGGLFGGLFGGGGGGLGLFDGIAGLASGTNFAGGGLTLVGEKGPELVNLPRGAQVIPNDVLRSRRASRQISQTIIVNVPQGTSGPSANQIALRVGSQTQRALSRDG